MCRKERKISRAKGGNIPLLAWKINELQRSFAYSNRICVRKKKYVALMEVRELVKLFFRLYLARWDHVVYQSIDNVVDINVGCCCALLVQ